MDAADRTVLRVRGFRCGREILMAVSSARAASFKRLSARLRLGYPRQVVGLAASFTFFQRVFQTRFLPFRFRVLRLNFLRETASM